jgi:hypothetical protein
MLPSILYIFLCTLVSSFFSAYGLVFNNNIMLLVSTLFSPTSDGIYNIIKTYLITKKINLFHLSIYVLIAIVVPIITGMFLGYVLELLIIKYYTYEKTTIEITEQLEMEAIVNILDEEINKLFENEDKNDKTSENKNKIQLLFFKNELSSIQHYINIQEFKEDKNNKKLNIKKRLIKLKNNIEIYYSNINNIQEFNIPSENMKEGLYYSRINMFFNIIMPFIACLFLPYALQNKNISLLIAISIALSFVKPLVTIGLFIGSNKHTNKNYTFNDYKIPLINFSCNLFCIVICSFIMIHYGFDKK